VARHQRVVYFSLSPLTPNVSNTVTNQEWEYVLQSGVHTHSKCFLCAFVHCYLINFSWHKCIVVKVITMEQSPSWEANSRSATQEVHRLLWNPEVHYHIHKRLSLFPILSHINPVHIITPDFYVIHFNIILSCMSRSSKWSFPFRFSGRNVVSLRFSSLSCVLHAPPTAPSVIYVTLESHKISPFVSVE
jgi:hypothetical protein